MSTTEEKNMEKNKDEEYEIDTATNDRLIKDHSYDGIQELDNDLPPWWKWLFYITIAIGIIYLVRLFVLKSDDLYQQKEYESAMAQAASQMPQQTATEAFKVQVLTDPADIEKGKEIFSKICSVCHRADGGGLVGPNFADDYWIHGNTIQDMFNTVTNGVLDKGMISYKDQLSPTQRLEVLSYIIKDIHGTNPENPKPPQGVKMEWPYK